MSDQVNEPFYKEIEKLKQEGVIKETHLEDREIISPIFITPKKDGNYRLILNLKYLNQYIEYSHFKNVRLTRNTWTCDIIVENSILRYQGCILFNSYWQSFQRYLKFRWKDKLYGFCVLSNGLSSCPPWFTKLLKLPQAEMRKISCSLSAYVHVFLQGENDSECILNICDTMKMIRKLDFVINVVKSQLEPTTKLKF